MFPLLYILWIVLNGRITWEILIVGLVLAVGLDLLSGLILGHSLRQSYRRMAGFLMLYRYFPMLLKDMLTCSFRVLLFVLNPRREVRPQLMYFTTGLTEENTQVLLADSITLTPGTITVELKDGRYRVHALDASFMKDIASCGLERELERLERLEKRYGRKR